MLSRTSKTSLFLAALVPVVLVACKVDIGDGNDPGYTKDEARELQGITPGGDDICGLEGWYDDQVCDDFCVEPDPDCPVSNCPDPNDPRVTYHGQPGDLTCAQDIDRCGPDQTTFNSADCGCGCIAPDPPGETCGGFAGEVCADGEFCEYPLRAMCGADDSLGTCQPMPQGCPENWDPVCGCDGVTYGNECDANAHGTSVAAAGECNVGPTCGGIAGEACEDGFFCNLDYQCSIEDAQGQCEPLPQACPDIWAPVCSCEGVTFSNACDAHAAGAAIAHDGTCEDPAISCGSGADADCPSGQFCNYTLRAMCGWADDLGTCEDLPQGCPDVYDPVCGCDGLTYGNDCEAHANGVAVVALGPCDADE